MQISLTQRESAKAEGYHAVCVQYVASSAGYLQKKTPQSSKPPSPDSADVIVHCYQGAPALSTVSALLQQATLHVVL
jgi:hypothetical protein